TMGDLMEQFYGTKSKIIAGTLGLMTSICIASMEMIVLGIVLQSLLGVKASWGVWIAGGALALYSAHGGIKAVTTTDVLQFAVLIIAIPMAAIVVVKHAGGVANMLAQVPETKFNILEHEKFSYYFTLFLIWSFIPAGMIDPAIIQRLLMSKRPDQLRKQYLIMAGISPLLRLIIMLIGLAGVVLYPTLEATKLFPHLIEELMPVGIKGITIAGVLAVSTSTIDSYLHVCGLTFAHDVLEPICQQRNITINELRWARYSTLLIGIIAVMIGAAGAGATTDTILGFAFTALGFTGPLLMFPLLAGIMGLKIKNHIFYIALCVTLGAYVIAQLVLPPDQSHLTMLITIAANGIAFFGAHFLLAPRSASVH
ncbi:MAG: sodium:solute symporter family protein, partial [Bacteroidota bacterium]